MKESTNTDDEISRESTNMSEEVSQESFDVEIKELEITEETIEISEALFISSGLIYNGLNLFKENKETLKIYGTDDYVLFIFGHIIPKTEYMNSTLVRSFNKLSYAYKNIPLFICHGLLRIPIEDIVKYLSEYQKRSEVLMIVAALTSSLNKNDQWFDKLEDEDYKFFIEKSLDTETAQKHVFLVVKVVDYIEFISE